MSYYVSQRIRFLLKRKLNLPAFLVNSFMNGTQNWFPMEWMKWAICHLEQLQTSFGHPNPIRDALHEAVKLQYIIYTLYGMLLTKSR